MCTSTSADEESPIKGSPRMTTLKVPQVVPPPPHAMTPHWAILLAPQEAMVTSKTGEFDESVLLDGSELPAVYERLAELRKGRPPQAPLWPFTYQEFVEGWTRHSDLAGVAKRGAEP